MPSPAQEISTAPRSLWWRDRVLPIVALLLMAAGLWVTRPADWSLRAAPDDDNAQACLSHLRRIAAAFAQYAQDYDGKFPRGVDPEDRHNPVTWRYGYESRYYHAARTAPMLHELLASYTRRAQVWRCPADVGWNSHPLPGMTSGLIDVKPSSFERFGTSYYYLTRHGFDGMRASDLKYPSQSVLLFDGAFWHGQERQSTLSRSTLDGDARQLNALFGDGHVGTLSRAEFRQALDLDIARWSGR